MADEGKFVVVDGSDEVVTGHRPIDDTDLEISYNMVGGNLVLRVNKAGVQIFRVLLVDAAKPLGSNALFGFNAVAPDFIFKVGDSRERMLALARSVGLDAAQLAKLETNLD